MEKTLIILTRHGETDWNSDSRIQGHTDIALNANGSAQAEALVERLADETIDIIYTSDLARAADTAEAVRRRRPDTRLLKTPLLRERNWGALEGLTRDEIKTGFPDDAARLASGDPDYAPAGGESKNQVRTRVQGLLDSLVRENQGKTILVVTHGGICAMALRIVLGTDMASRAPFRIDNCSITTIACGEDGSIWVESLNCTCHLSTSIDGASAIWR